MTDLSGADDTGVEPSAELVEVSVERLVAGGVAIARRGDGRVVLVEGAIPPERCVVEIEHLRGADRGRIVQVIESSPLRIEPVCAEVARGCGGCDLAAMSSTSQVDAKVDIVIDALRRLGRWVDPIVEKGPALDPWAFRTTMRFAVVDGRLALRTARSHEAIVIDRCEIAHPLVQELVEVGRFGGCDEVTVRVAPGTGERMVRCAPSASGVEVPDDVRVIGVDELRSGRRSWLHDELLGRRWRISADSFFQTRADGAMALVGAVAEMASDVLDRPRGVMVDAYCGVGLFAGALLEGRAGWSGIAAERGRSSIADARRNLADLDVRVIETDVDQLRVAAADLVVADPSRAGLGRRAVAAITRPAPERIVLVSCDPAAAGRDTALLIDAGYQPIRSAVVDLFPHTHHVEVVTRFDRGAR